MPYACHDNAISYRDTKSGFPIIFISGFGGVGSFWNRQVEFFQDRFRIVTYDQRGTGASARTRQAYSIRQMVDDLETVMDAARIDTAVLVGHSTGGAIAQTLAALAPERVSGLLLSSTWCKPGGYFRRVFEFRRSLLKIGATHLFHEAGILLRYPPAYSEENDALFENPSPVDVEITIARIDAILKADQSSLISQIRAPTLVVAARDDCLIPQFMSDEVAQRIGDSEYLILDHGGHFLPETRTAQYNEALNKFLGSLAPSGATE
jgi:aminoacrylate hydrolase